MAKPVRWEQTALPELLEKRTTHSPMELKRPLPDKLAFLFLQSKKMSKDSPKYAMVPDRQVLEAQCL
jgi:hypothetical protein